MESLAIAMRQHPTIGTRWVLSTQPIHSFLPSHFKSVPSRLDVEVTRTSFETISVKTRLPGYTNHKHIHDIPLTAFYSAISLDHLPRGYDTNEFREYVGTTQHTSPIPSRLSTLYDDSCWIMDDPPYCHLIACLLSIPYFHTYYLATTTTTSSTLVNHDVDPILPIILSSGDDEEEPSSQEGMHGESITRGDTST